MSPGPKLADAEASRCCKEKQDEVRPNPIHEDDELQPDPLPSHAASMPEEPLLGNNWAEDLWTDESQETEEETRNRTETRTFLRKC